jgi:O-antigen/teichoic acid export membrane protein
VSRLRQFTQGVASSWLATFITVVYSLLSVPIALKFLSVDEFALWVLMMQVAGYFSLIELGMAGSTARILIDYKDERDTGRYGSVILTGALVFAAQGFLILIAGVLVAPILVAALSVPPGLKDVAVYLLRWLAVAFAIGSALRIFSSVLYANRRVDLVVLLMSVIPLLGLALMWILLANGLGLRGMAYAFVPPALLAGAGSAVAAFWLGLMPRRSGWRAPTWGQFREMFLLGKDMFLITVGNQVLEASQLIIVTRTMGLGAAAIWSVSTKLFALVYQLVNKVEGTAIVFFSEMMVRGETTRLALRFRNVYQLTAGLAVVALAFVTAVNQQFVAVWTTPSLAWSPLLGLLLGLVVYLNCVTKCQVDLILHSKDIRGLRFVYLFEAIGFVVLAIYSSSYIGFSGVLLAAIVCAILFRGVYAVHRTAIYFNLPASLIAWSWLRRSLLAGALLLPFVLTAPYVASFTNSPWAQLVLSSLWAGIPSLVVLSTVALPHDVKTEVLGKFLPHFRNA